MLLAKKIFEFHARVQKCHFGKNEKLPRCLLEAREAEKNRMYALLEPKDAGLKHLLSKFEDPWGFGRTAVAVAGDSTKIKIEQSSG